MIPLHNSSFLLLPFPGMTALHNSSFILLPFQPRLPDWLGLVVTSRPEFDVKTPLQALNPFPLDTKSESNRADIRDYLRRELATQLQQRLSGF